ncbi:helix-turn-helix domain-containing protein [Polyangium jinanense]|uniref:Helix-turn-helix transcriptional regulator n=1 Tax=Polyangium jinanense TaxID=2829994 RepID=A0A9X4APL2_9BACT|nr:helix-turn-helix transcriptional regulator [Polyangium jinanense]MDC3953463.1 helix-turn-helix transcriptional regulator [Polyangium jinanense]MDC3979416.1 helix-turn-helix transcriptional regulator [Polyangium jinanense]
MPRRSTPEPYAAKIGARLRELRVERGVSLGQVADASQLSKGHLSSIEHGLAAITVPTIFRIAQALELPPLYLFTFPDEDERARVAELVRKMPTREVAKVRRELAKR